MSHKSWIGPHVMKIYYLFKHALNVFLKKNCLDISSFMLKMIKRRKRLTLRCNLIFLYCVHLGQNGNYKITLHVPIYLTNKTKN